jgi:flavin-binding protein dodecin
MSDHVYRVTEIVGSSNGGIDEAICSALERAQHTLRNVDWFEVTARPGAAWRPARIQPSR